MRHPARLALRDRSLHGQWAPVDSFPGGTSPQADLVIYHLRMLQARDRRERQARAAGKPSATTT